MPPTASTMDWKPAKSITAKWSTRTPVSCSTVWMSSGGPPNAYAALILFWPWPGMSTQLSRGMDTTEAPVRCGSILASISTSLRCDPASTPGSAAVARRGLGRTRVGADEQEGQRFRIGRTGDSVKTTERVR